MRIEQSILDLRTINIAWEIFITILARFWSDSNGAIAVNSNTCV